MTTQAAVSAALRRCLQRSSRPSAFTPLRTSSCRRPRSSRAISSATSASVVATFERFDIVSSQSSGLGSGSYQHRNYGKTTNLHDSSKAEAKMMASYYDGKDHLGDGDEFSAEDMEFYDDLAGGFNIRPNEGESEEDELARLEEEEAKRQAVRDELDSRTGRLWTDRWEITDDDWSSGVTFEELPDWSETICSRVSLERVQVHPDGVPTLDKLASTPLPPASVPHPALGNPHPYLKHRKDAIFNAIVAKVESFASPKMDKILSMEDWNEKQEAIDDLFEKVYDAVKNSDKDKEGYVSVVLGHQPDFAELVEKAMTEYLKKVVDDERTAFKKSKTESDSEDTEEVSDEDAVPVFMELGATAEAGEGVVPKILIPLRPHAKDGPGRMVEEWELSANQKTRRIMCRQSIREIAKALTEEQGGARVYVNGRKGAGKSAALAAIVASARTSGHIVLYLPDGDRLRKNGFYIDSNEHKKDSEGPLFDLPMLSKEVCDQLSETHAKDMEGMQVTKDCLEKHFSKDGFKKLRRVMGDIDEVDSIPVGELLKIGSEEVSIAALCYSSVIETLMTQDSKPFTIVADDFNCYYDHGHYFHEDYDKDVKHPIPLDRITLFKPLTDAMGVAKTNKGQLITKEPVVMKNGGIVVGTTESHAVARKFTSALTDSMEQNGSRVVTIPQYSHLEVEHILANLEIAGVGRLRFDRGETVMNDQEVRFLRMVSGGLGQPLLDAVCG